MKNEKHNQISRRGFLGSAAAVAAAAAIAPSMVSCGPQVDPYANALKTADGKPNSKFNGLQIGAITYSFRGVNGTDEIIAACIEGNVSSIELMGNGLEAEVGAPTNPVQRSGGFGGGMPGGAMPAGAAPAGAPAGARTGAPAGAAPAGAPAGAAMPRMQQPELTEEEKALQAKYEEDLAAFRKDPATMEKWAALAKKFTDAGIEVHILKWTAGNTDELLDYSFNVAKVFGAKAICAEASEETCKTLGAAAERNGLLAVYHNHAQYASMTVADIEKWLAYSPANRLNFDCGHYYGFGYDNSTKLDIIQFIDHFNAQILSVHFKDKTKLTNEFASNQNQVWGQGETPVREVLQHLRDNYPHLYCDIELEYPVPAWSTSAKEVAKCVRYAREALI